MNAGFFAELMSKDVQLYRHFVEQTGAPHKVGDQVAEIWQHVADTLPPQSDFTRIYEVMKKETET